VLADQTFKGLVKVVSRSSSDARTQGFHCRHLYDGKLHEACCKLMYENNSNCRGNICVRCGLWLDPCSVQSMYMCSRWNCYYNFFAEMAHQDAFKENWRTKIICEINYSRSILIACPLYGQSPVILQSAIIASILWLKIENRDGIW
jgi:hypothetical protein